MTLKSLFKGKFIREWIAANTLAILIACGIAEYLVNVLFLMEYYPVAIVPFIASIIIFQFLVLRKRITHARLWILSGVLGIILGSITFVILIPETNSLENPFAIFTVIFVSIISLLVTQWLILDQEYYRAWLWIPFNIVGIIAATYIADVIADVIARMVWLIYWKPIDLTTILIFSGLASCPVFGMVFGLITGIGLRIFFMKYPKNIGVGHSGKFL